MTVFDDSDGRSSCERRRFRGGSPLRVLAAVAAASALESRSILRRGRRLGGGREKHRRDSPPHTAHARRRPQAQGGRRLRTETHPVRRALRGDVRFSSMFNFRRFGFVSVCLICFSIEVN